MSLGQAKHYNYYAFQAYIGNEKPRNLCLVRVDATKDLRTILRMLSLDDDKPDNHCVCSAWGTKTPYTYLLDHETPYNYNV